MKLSGSDYIEGAQARIKAANLLLSQGSYVDAIYSAGVAVECVLRAFAKDCGDTFDGRHDLKDLAKASIFEQIDGLTQRQALAAALGEVWSRWKNNYRYVGETRLKAEFKKNYLDRGIRGDWLKENARTSVENALTIVNRGTFRWKQM